MEKKKHLNNSIFLSPPHPTELEKLFRLELVSLAMQIFRMSKTDILLAYYEPDTDYDGYLNHPNVTIEHSDQLKSSLIKALGGKTLLKTAPNMHHHFKRHILESDLEL